MNSNPLPRAPRASPPRRDQHRNRHPVDRAEVELERHRREPDERGDRDLDQRAEHDPPGRAQPPEREREPEHQRRGEQRRRERLRAPARVRLDRAVEGELRRAVGVEHAPVRAGAAFVRLLPRLVEHFHQVVVERAAGGAREEVAHERGLRGGRGDRAADAVAPARPADLADHDALLRERAAELGVARERVVDRVLGRHAFPVGQQVHGDEVDVARELRVAQPHVPRLGGRDRDAHLALHARDVGDERRDAQVAAQDRFVADDDAVDVGVLAREAHERGDLALVVLVAPVEPRAGRDPQTAHPREARGFAVLGRRVGPHAVRVGRDEVEVRGELVLGREDARGRVLVALVAAERDAVHLAGTVGQGERRMGGGPEGEVRGCDQDGDHARGDEGGGRTAFARRGQGMDASGAHCSFGTRGPA